MSHKREKCEEKLLVEKPSN